MTDAKGLSADKRALLERRLRGARLASAPQIPPRAADVPPPLSFAQRQMWVIDQLVPGNPAYNLPFGYRIRGPLDVAALERAFNAVITRHESLRTSFAMANGEPVQVVHEDGHIVITATSLVDLPTTERETRLGELATVFSMQPFDLARLPLVRLAVFAVGDDEHVLIFNIHHIAIDGMSTGLLFEELDSLYLAQMGGAVSPLPTLPIQYADFAAWQRQAVLAKSNESQLSYWQQQLHGPLPVLDLPGDYPRPARQSFAGSNVFFVIPKPVADALAALGAREGCTFFMTALAAFGVVLHRYATADDIIVGTPLANRTPTEVESLIGNFLNTLPLRIDLSGNPTFLELLGRVRGVTLDTLSNGDVPFEIILTHTPVERDPSRNPVYQALLQVLPAESPRLGSLVVTPFHFDLGIAQLDLSLHLYEETDGYHGRFEYCTDLFRAETIERLAEGFQQLLNDVIGNPDQKVSALTIMPISDRQWLLHAWNATAAPFPAEARMHDMFEEQVDRSPERVAVRSGAESLTYGELEARANQIAHALGARGVGRGSRVGLCLDRNPDMLAAVLGVLKTGAAYVPLDPSFPEERLRFMVEDAELALLVSAEALAEPFGFARERCLLLDADAAVLAAASAARLAPDERAARPEDPAYVIYTSGSTGKPKGVAVPHRAVVNFLVSMANAPGLAANDVLVAVTTLSFDIAVLELQLPLAQGATVVIASRDEATSGAALKEVLARHAATVLQATPASWRMLLEAGWEPRSGFKALVGGESLPADVAAPLLAHGVELWNVYGPTETTVWSTCARITSATDITIGRPIANTTVYVLDEHGELCPVGVPGELCIGGVGVALGYWKRPDLTAERFVPDPFSTVPGARLYRTGDRVRWLADGRLDHQGRLDFQVKVNGYRIELGEIESLLAAISGVGQAVVVVRGDVGSARLVAYIVPESGVSLPDSAELRRELRRHLPDYMVPGMVVELAALPLTPNGKVDRKALPDPVADVGAAHTALDPPQPGPEATIAAIWQELLGVALVSRHDNFFDLGGHSLLAVQAIAQIETRIGVRVPIRQLIFESLSVIAASSKAAAPAVIQTKPEKVGKGFWRRLLSK